jgi:phosphatidylinositol phospholipase C delta
LERVFAHYASNIPGTGKISLDNKDPESTVLLLTLDGFTSYLMSLDNAPFSDQNQGVYHDMSRPLSEYYISSSHNTYLIGHQLVGESTIEGYIRALLNSCRCVESTCRPAVLIETLS